MEVSDINGGIIINRVRVPKGTGRPRFKPEASTGASLKYRIAGLWMGSHHFLLFAKRAVRGASPSRCGIQENSILRHSKLDDNIPAVVPGISYIPRNETFPV
jgi:hypothetical protein